MVFYSLIANEKRGYASATLIIFIILKMTTNKKERMLERIRVAKVRKTQNINKFIHTRIRKLIPAHCHHSDKGRVENLVSSLIDFPIHKDLLKTIKIGNHEIKYYIFIDSGNINVLYKILEADKNKNN